MSTPAPAPAPFPHHYDVRLAWTQGQGARLDSEQRPALVGGPPAQFGGRTDWWTPEHLLLAASALCLQTTFDSFCRRARLEVKAYETRGEAVLDKTAEGLVFTGITLHVRLAVAAADVERAGELMHKAKKYCIVSNALRPAVELDLTVDAA
jgi:organic hydroperoxide reductase OsmC/OhrA